MAKRHILILAAVCGAFSLFIGVLSSRFFSVTPAAQARELQNEVTELMEEIPAHDVECNIGKAKKDQVTALEKQIILLVGTGSFPSRL